MAKDTVWDIFYRLLAVETDDCVIWPRALNSKGYGIIVEPKPAGAEKPGKAHLTHRLALTLTQGPPPTPAHETAHAPIICHNRRCMNPRHLRWATRSENAKDMIQDGTFVPPWDRVRQRESLHLAS